MEGNGRPNTPSNKQSQIHPGTANPSTRNPPHRQRGNLRTATRPRPPHPQSGPQNGTRTPAGPSPTNPAPAPARPRKSTHQACTSMEPPPRLDRWRPTATRPRTSYPNTNHVSANEQDIHRLPADNMDAKLPHACTSQERPTRSREPHQHFTNPEDFRKEQPHRHHRRAPKPVRDAVHTALRRPSVGPHQGRRPALSRATADQRDEKLTR